MIFDNRQSKVSREAAPGRHFVFEANKKKIVYCYIRKNASSSFKRFIISQSREKHQRKAFQTSFKFLSRYHTTRSKRFESFDHSIFVVRNPADRILSVFMNKFVQRSSNVDIFENYLKVTGKDPKAATFSDFITEYVARPFSELDVHVRPQSHELLPTIYSDAIPIKYLHPRMTEIIGRKLADRYFLPKVNSTSDTDLISLDGAFLLQASELRRIYLTNNELPAASCFMSESLRLQIEGTYAQDFDLYRRVGQSP